MLQPLPHPSSESAKRARYAVVSRNLRAILDGEDDWVSAMATVACELHHAFEAYHWTGFYRVIRPGWLGIGPYQGGHGCLRIPFETGVCGAAARERMTQLVHEVTSFPGHIACSATTRSEIVVPILTSRGRLIGVLDVDSDHPSAFDPRDQEALEGLAAFLGRVYG